MPQVQPFIGTLHVVRFFFQLPQLFGGQTHAIVDNGERNGRVRTGKEQADGTALWIMVDAVLYQIVNCGPLPQQNISGQCQCSTNQPHRSATV